MKILVTGGLGVVGSPLVKELRKRGYDTWVCDRYLHYDEKYFKCDIGEFRQVQQILEKEKFDVVYNLAAEFGRYNGEHFYETLWKTNVIGLKNIIRNQEKLRFKLVHFSSSEVYGDYKGVMKEDVLEQVPIRQLNDYAITKWVNEMQVMNSAEVSNTETVRVRLFNTYGPGEYYSPYRSATTIFIYHALHEKPYNVYLNHHRSPTYIDDCVNALANIVENFKPGEVYNICGDEYVSIKEISDIILDYLGLDDSLVNYVPFEAHNTLNKKGDN
ncbi:MAG: NAD-dependent epimerase/dehydratase family protein, partial [Promethearchaeota archaeon]